MYHVSLSEKENSILFFINSYYYNMPTDEFYAA